MPDHDTSHDHDQAAPPTEKRITAETTVNERKVEEASTTGGDPNAAAVTISRQGEPVEKTVTTTSTEKPADTDKKD